MKRLTMILLMAMVLPAQALVQSGWLDVTQVAAGSNLTGIEAKYMLCYCDTVNNHVAREGSVYGATFKLVTGAKAALGANGKIFFAVLRWVSGDHDADPTYKIIGKSNEFSYADISDGTVNYEFDDPIEGCLPSDVMAVGWRPDTGSVNLTRALNDTDAIIDDEGDTDKVGFNWYPTAGADAYTDYVAGTAYSFAGGAGAYAPLAIAALMNPPKVIVVGDSISCGSPLNIPYRYDAGANEKSDFGSFASVAYHALGWECELAGNTQSSNNLAETYTNDMTAAVTAKLQTDGTGYLHVHCGVNDIYDGRTLPQTLSSLESILAYCRTNNVKLILTAIFPYNGKDDNTTGTAAMHVTGDAWNAGIKAWASGKTDVLYFNVNESIGVERQFAKSGDGAPPAGNLWDLVPDYLYTADTFNVHLTEPGAAAAGGALAGMIRAWEYTSMLRNNLRAKRQRLRYDAWAPIRQWFFGDN